MRRTRETAGYIAHHSITIDYEGDDVGRAQEWVQLRPVAWSNLDELFAGLCDGMTYGEIEKHYPDEFRRRQNDKLAYRYPRGESYYDLISRLDPVVHEMIGYQEPLLIVSHQALLRPLRAFLLGEKRENCPSFKIPLHTVMKITWDGWHPPKEEHIYLGPAITKDDGQKNL